MKYIIRDDHYYVINNFIYMNEHCNNKNHYSMWLQFLLLYINQLKQNVVKLKLNNSTKTLL